MIVEVSAITPGIGAEITGLDISQPMNKKTIARLREFFLRHLVFVYRDQALSREDQKQFSRYFGELHVHPSPRSGLKKAGDPKILSLTRVLMLNKATGKPGPRMSVAR